MRTCFLPKLASDLRHSVFVSVDPLVELPVELEACTLDFDLDFALDMDDVPSRVDDDEGAGPGWSPPVDVDVGGGDVGRGGVAPVNVRVVGDDSVNRVDEDALDMARQWPA